MSNPAPHAYPMLHPFQTDTFDPGDPELHKRVRAGQPAHVGFHIGSTAYLVDGERWIYFHQTYPYPCRYEFASKSQRTLAYPLPESFGEDPHLAMNVFVKAWNAERLRLWALEPLPEPEPPAPPPTAPIVAASHSQPRRLPRGRAVGLAGAVPLPGLEPWTEYGRLR